ncbi:hypothetical protein TPL01_14930 [Sulfuriferula plumbiphila]|uniref:HTH cro/C1-type domain-containing protein n=1 Tax=Sulfuriferula plumbiphila TaxID=171865 RepID=A0A512L793_9PROT|nr:helix-turn-helix transcriptional regulator [Sulfuriferula plumbiphila]BBP05318.1 hypothetical protein SFPGR_27400 [Sulfuriferula plumbiphila]GEP30355.1 hypothetical protein TPL01_14930 [Sulfuriferula plumbiphila]
MTNDNKQAYVPPEQGIGERIRMKRAEIEGGLSVEDLSRVCKEFDHEDKGISRLALSRYEAGKFMPGARELRILCHALGVSPNWLLFGSESAKWPPETEVMVTALSSWVKAQSSEGKLWDMFLPHSPENDLMRSERIRKAIAKKPKT